MIEKHLIINLIFSAIEDVNETLPADKRIPRRGDAVIYGEGSSIDSLELTLLIVALEQHIEKQFQAVISLADGMVSEPDESPFYNVDRLAGYISRLVDAKVHG